MLEVRDLDVRYGAVPAVRGLQLSVPEGRAVALLGRNGAGKSSTLLALAGLARCRGRITFAGTEIARVPVERRASMGLVLCPEGRRVFPGLDVTRNLMMGGYSRSLSRRALADEIDRVTERFPRLRERLSQRAGSLSGGEQQMLAIARALMGRPRLLMVDEPSLGLAPAIVDELYELLANLRDDGLTLLVVEQYVERALGFADHVYVIEKGVVAAEGPPAELEASGKITAVYMAATGDGSTRAPAVASDGR